MISFGCRQKVSVLPFNPTTITKQSVSIGQEGWTLIYGSGDGRAYGCG